MMGRRMIRSAEGLTRKAVMEMTAKTWVRM